MASEGTAASSAVFELAMLGLLTESPMHGYELRKRLASRLGTLRAFSYGSLYPLLRRLADRGLVQAENPTPDADAVPLSSKRSRVVYRITDAGNEHLAGLLDDCGPTSWSDDGFGVHLAFFSWTRPEARLRILEGRRKRVEERQDGLRAAATRAAERMDQYTVQLHRLGLQATENEARWLTELIAGEKAAGQAASGSPASQAPSHRSTTAANRTEPRPDPEVSRQRSRSPAGATPRRPSRGAEPAVPRRRTSKAPDP